MDTSGTTPNTNSPTFLGCELSELEMLLKRIQPREQKWTEPSREPSPYLNALLGRMEAREWQQDTLERLVLYLKECANEVKMIMHLRKCKDCQLEAQLEIERHGGSHLGLWFLDLINDPFECGDDVDFETYPWLKDCPRARDYKIGSYWSGSSEDTLRFINDRVTWAEKLIRQDIWAAVDFYKRVKDWDLAGAQPISDIHDFYA